MKSIALALLLAACTDEAASRAALDSAGFTEITITGYSSRCGEDDTFATGFRARNPAGKIVKGAVCCGALFKGCTVRF